MHEVIKDRLEERLWGRGPSAIPGEFEDHLNSCGACAGDFRKMQSQSKLFASLRHTSQAELPANFYAKVLQRIEERKNAETFWAPLVDRGFGRRLAYGFAALVLVLGTYLVSSEPPNPDIGPTGLVVADTTPAATLDGQVQPQQRDAVLVNLASYSE